MMNAEMIQEFELMQQSRANKFSGDLAERFFSSVDAVKDSLTHSMSQRGKMLMALEKRFSMSKFKSFRKRFLNF